MPSELSYTIELKRRKGVSLWCALIRTLPGHYHLLRKNNGRFLSLCAALRIVFAGFDWYRFLAPLRDLCWTVMGAPVRGEDVTL